jgi:cytosine/adenosine deaminase-related metal-dependent hydrolase
VSLVRVGDAAALDVPLDLHDHLVFAGLINAHDHLQLNNVPSLRHAEPFANSYDWIDAFEAHRSDPAVTAAVDVPAAARCWQGALKNLVCGATTVAHHDPWNVVFDDPGFPVEVLRDYGWSHSLWLGEPRAGGAPRYGPAVRTSFDDTPRDQPWIIHLAEGTDAVAAAELRQLDALGCLAANTVLVHGVGMSGADIDLVLERGTAVVWCPSSNIEMFGRTLDAHTVRRLFDAGRIAIGTDSRLTGSRDLLDELRVAAAHSDLTPAELLSLATSRGAEILRRAGHGGDCVIVRAGAGADAAGTLLETARSGVRAVVRRGVPLIADPDFAGWFDQSAVDTVEISLDGHPKLIAKHVLNSRMSAAEPGLEITRAA